MAGGHVLLVTGGAGFLGYYLVQALLEWNKRSGRGERISLTVLDNYIRGVRSGSAVEQHRAVAPGRARHRQPLPDDIGRLRLHHSCRGIASPTTTASIRSRRWMPTSTGCDICSTAPRGRRARAGGRRVPVLLQQRNLRRPDRDAIPTPETYPGRVSCTGPRAATTNRSATAKRSASISRSSTACRSRWCARSTTTARA